MLPSLWPLAPGKKERAEQELLQLSGHLKEKDGGRGGGGGDHWHRAEAAADTPVRPESDGTSNWRLRRKEQRL